MSCNASSNRRASRKEDPVHVRVVIFERNAFLDHLFFGGVREGARFSSRVSLRVSPHPRRDVDLSRPCRYTVSRHLRSARRQAKENLFSVRRATTAETTSASARGAAFDVFYYCAARDGKPSSPSVYHAFGVGAKSTAKSRTCIEYIRRR